MKTKLFISVLVSVCILIMGGCKKDRGYGNMTVSMRDAPGTYQEVNVEILRVRVHMAGGWIELPTHAGIYNLLALQNGIDTTIVSTTQLPAGEIDQMRLVLGTNNSVVADSVAYPLTTPSGSESGIKLVGNISVPGNSSINVLLDFVAGESVVETGHLSFVLKPVINVVQ